MTPKTDQALTYPPTSPRRRGDDPRNNGMGPEMHLFSPQARG